MTATIDPASLDDGELRRHIALMLGWKIITRPYTGAVAEFDTWYNIIKPDGALLWQHQSEEGWRFREEDIWRNATRGNAPWLQMPNWPGVYEDAMSLWRLGDDVALEFSGTPLGSWDVVVSVGWAAYSGGAIYSIQKHALTLPRAICLAWIEKRSR
jgi:hypothetical protein